MNTNTLTLSIFTLGFILCLQAADNSRTQSDFLTLKDRLAGEAETPDEREEVYLKNDGERAILQQLRRRFQPYFPKDHPIYTIPRHVTGRLIEYEKMENIHGEDIDKPRTAIIKLDTLPLEWDFKLTKDSFSLGEVIWGTLTVRNPNETPLILSIPYVGGEYINSIELWKAVLGKHNDPDHYHAYFPSI